MSIKISVIVPIYNVEKYLPECLKSITNQTLKDIEIICVNDGSPDNSMDIVKKFAKKDNRIKTINMKKNSGPGPAKNEGIKIATGEFVAFIDSDDYYTSNDVLEKLYKSAKKHKVKACNGNVLCFDNKTGFKYTSTALPYIKENTLINYTDYPYSTGYTTFIFDRKTVKEIPFPKYRRGEDPVFLAEILQKIKTFYHINQNVYSYRITDNLKVIQNEQTANQLAKSFLDNLKLFKKQNLKKHGLQEYKRFIKNYEIHFKHLLKNNQESDLYKTVKKIQSYNEFNLKTYAFKARFHAFCKRIIPCFIYSYLKQLRKIFIAKKEKK